MIVDPPLEDLGPAMLALTPLQRRFVIGWIAIEGKDASRAARAAGYANNTEHDSAKVKAFYNLRNPKIIKAIHEEAGRRLSTMAIYAVFALEKNMKRGNAKARQSAADSVLDRTGYPRRTEQALEVDDRRPATGKSHEQLLTMVYEKLKVLSESARAVPAVRQAIEATYKEIEDVAQADAIAPHKDERQGD
jgi:phage terminase small subunit